MPYAINSRPNPDRKARVHDYSFRNYISDRKTVVAPRSKLRPHIDRLLFLMVVYTENIRSRNPNMSWGGATWAVAHFRLPSHVLFIVVSFAPEAFQLRQHVIARSNRAE